MPRALCESGAPFLAHLVGWDAVDPVPDRVDDGDVDDGLGGRAAERAGLREEEVLRAEAARVHAAVEAAADLVVLRAEGLRVVERGRQGVVPARLEEVHFSGCTARQRGGGWEGGQTAGVASHSRVPLPEAQQLSFVMAQPLSG